MKKDQKLKCIDLSSEMRLLLLCASKDISEDEKKKIYEMMSCRIDWKHFLELTVKNRVYPIVYRNLAGLAKAQENLVNEKLLTALKKQYEMNRMNSIKLAAELIRVMSIFEKKGIKAISLKGPLLGLSIYGDISLRTSRDLDILVGIEEFEKAEDVLLNEGYVKEGYTGSLSDKQKNVLLKTNHHFVYINKRNGVDIELHWRYFYELYNFEFEEIWKNKTEAETSGRKINVLSGEENFLYLIFHGSMHAWKRLKWLCDICEIIKNDSLDWSYIFKRSKKLGISHMLGQALILSNMLFNTELHAELLDNDKTYSIANKLAAMSLPFILHSDGSAESAGHPLYLNRKKYMRAWVVGLSRKFVYIRMHFYPIVTDFEEFKFSDRYFFMYYLIGTVQKIKRKITRLKAGKVC